MSVLSKALAQTRRDERGVTLIELMISIVIFGIVAGAVAVGLGSTLNLSRNNRNRSIAANLAAREMDLVRSAEFDSIVVGHVESSETLDGIPYGIARDAEWIPKDASTGACDSPSGSRLAYLRVDVEVDWPNMGGIQPVRSQTILTPPVGAYDPNTGHLAVKVLDRSAQPVSGLNVTISGPGGSESQFTAEGCAFFAYLAPGAYTAAVNTVGFVTPEGLQAASQPTSVVAAQIVSLQFDYDQASTLNLTLGADASYPVPDGLVVSLGNQGLLLGVRTFPGAGNPRTIGSLFPFPDGYQPWTGACDDADPQGELPGGGPIYAGGQRQAAIATDPGLSTSGVVTMERVDVRVLGPGGIPQSGVAVTAQHPAKEGCGAESFALGSTDVAGFVRASLPYGSWTFLGGSSQNSSVLDPTQDDPTLVVIQQ